MAIFHLNAKVVSRGKGQSAIAAAAYRSGQVLIDEQTGEIKNYPERAGRVVFTGIMAPKDAPDWTQDRNALWNKAERAEKRKDAQLAREIEVALPHELTGEQREWLVKDFAREAFVRRGYVVDLAIHAPDKHDPRNHHAHLMITRRTVGPDGFAATKDWQFDPKQLAGWRAQWASLANRHLARYGHAARIDHRSLDAQGIDREATTHLGHAAVEMTQRGAQSDRADEHSGIVARNAERGGLRRQLADADREVAALEGEKAQEERARQEHAAAEQRRQAQAAQEAARAAEASRQLAAKFERAAQVERQGVGDRQTAEAALRRLAQQDARPTEIGQGFHQAGKDAATTARAERREEQFWQRQEDWHASKRPAPAFNAPKPSAPGLHVIDSATGAVSKLGDFVTDLLAGASPAPPQPSKRDQALAYINDPTGRGAQQRAARQAAFEAESADKALERIRRDMQAGRNLKSEDIKSLTRQHQEQIRHFGDSAVSQMVESAQKRAEAYWKGDERERER